MMPRNLRKHLVTLVLVFVVSASLTVPALAKTITVMTRENMIDEHWKEAKALFTAKTGIEVEEVGAAGWGDLQDKVTVMAAGGIAPDAVYHDNGAQNKLVTTGIMQPIDNFVERSGLNLGIWPEAVVNAYRYNGQLYSLPTGVSSHAMYYNADLLAAAGIADLPTDWNSADFTLADMVTTAKKLTVDNDGDGTPERYGIDDFFYYGSKALPLWNLKWINDEKTKFLGANEAQMEAVDEIARIHTEYGIIGGNFVEGTAAITPRQAWYLNTLKGAMDNGGFFTWKVGVLPKVNARGNQTGFHSWGIPVGANEPDAGWEFIKFITTDPQGSILFSQSENRIPVVPASLNAFEERWNEINPGMHADVLTSGLETVWRMNFDGLPSSAWGNLAATMRRIGEGEISARNGMIGLAPVMASILKEAQRN